MAKKAEPKKFYDDERYKKFDELIRKHATGLCLDQIKLPNGGVLEKWQVGRHVVVLLCEYRGHNVEWLIEVFRPVELAHGTWPDLDNALAVLATNKDPLKDFARKYMLARETGQYTSLDEDAVELLGGVYEENSSKKEE